MYALGEFLIVFLWCVWIQNRNVNACTYIYIYMYMFFCGQGGFWTRQQTRNSPIYTYIWLPKAVSLRILEALPLSLSCSRLLTTMIKTVSSYGTNSYRSHELLIHKLLQKARTLIAPTLTEWESAYRTHCNVCLCTSESSGQRSRRLWRQAMLGGHYAQVHLSTYMYIRIYMAVPRRSSSQEERRDRPP